MFRRSPIILLLAATLCPGLCQFVYSHPGRTDASGGHHARKNGGYHYHNSGRRSSSVSRPSISSPRSTERSGSFGLRGRSSFTSEQHETSSKPKPKPKPKGRHWYGPNGLKIAVGDPVEFNKKTCVLTIDDGVNPKQSIDLGDLALIDQAFVLDDLKPDSPYKKHQLRWTSHKGTYHIFAMPIAATTDSIPPPL